MGRALFKMGDDQYIEWSSIVDTAVTFLMTRAESVEEWGEERVARADKNGHSYQDAYMQNLRTPEQLIGCNRGGPGEECLTLQGFMRRYKDLESYNSFTFQPGDRIEHGYVDSNGDWVEYPEPKII